MIQTDLMSFNERLNLEERDLRRHIKLPIKERIVNTYARHDNAFILQFYGPKNTRYEINLFTVKCILNDNYPIKHPDIYWIGLPPDHHFYKGDNRSNLANTHFGIYSFWYTPDKSLIEIIGRIRYSLTKEGEMEMGDDMY